ncbi:zf-HC2 domain-containing protein [Dactylosporangium siamense]|uniref:Membrane protein n=1 Tax=Dactylosporangium siamense TaxID=685454 RepID=A0A919PES5_9ACTN|nr:zf-HC2 domain-containing protein [Dactylosporangium siamense]GIG42062.1 membrane protein [Dactylosporangium siamense]
MERSPAAGCEAFREALSARLDGEAEPIDAALTDAHLLRCAGCRTWHADAADATRLVRVQQVSTQPAGSDALLAALDAHGVLPVPPVPPVPSNSRISRISPFLSFLPRGRRALVLALRVLLGAFGAAQFVLGIAQVTSATTATEQHGSGSGHLWHESAAWNVAIGAGFGWIASRRGRPAGALPMLTAFVALLALLSVNDVIAGRVETERLLSHGFVLAGYAIVLALTRPALDPDRPGSSSSGAGSGSSSGSGAGSGATPPPRRLRLVPGQATAHTDREAA